MRRSPDHDKTFEILLTVFDIEAKGEGKNKKSAEQNAAANAIAILKEKKRSIQMNIKQALIN